MSAASPSPHSEAANAGLTHVAAASSDANAESSTRTRRRQPVRARHVTMRLWIGGGLTTLLILVAALAPLLTPYPPDAVMPEARLHPPSVDHWFGTDMLGRDMLSRVLHGSRLALSSAFVGVGTAAALGIPLGLIAGYYAGPVDRLLSRVIEIWLGFPPLLLAIIIVARAGPTLRNAVIALGIVTAPSFFRVTRGSVLGLREANYIEAARLVGAGPLRILLHHLLPNIAPPLLVFATMRMGRLILAGGALSFVGLGAQPPQPEWGALLATGRDYLMTAPWLAIFPGVATTLAVLGLNLLGEGLRDLLEREHERGRPRRTGRRGRR